MDAPMIAFSGINGVGREFGSKRIYDALRLQMIIEGGIRYYYILILSLF